MSIDVLTFEPAPARGKLSKVIKNPFVAEAKYDGVRMVLAKIGNTVTMTGRRTSSVTGEKLDKAASVPHLVEAMKRLPYDVVLDGELVVKAGADTTSNDVVSIIGSKTEVAIAKQQKIGGLFYVVFDVLAENAATLLDYPYKYRKERRQEIVLWLVDKANSPYFLEVDTISGDRLRSELEYYKRTDVNLNDPEQFLEAAFASARADGYEGLIVKTLNGLYDKREWAKMKPSETYDFVIVGYQESNSDTFSGNGIAALTLGLYDSDRMLWPVTECSGMTHAWRREFYENPQKYLNMVVEVTAQEMFKTGALRHPRFKRLRPDADPFAQTFTKYHLGGTDA